MTEHRIQDQDGLDDLEYEDVPDVERWTLALKEDGDLRFSDHTKQLTTTQGATAVAQALRVALGTIEGEDPIDGEFGLDVFTATQSNAHLEREVRRTMIYDDYQHDRVESVDNVDIVQQPGSRTAHVSVEVTLDSGETDTLVFDLPV